MALDRVSLFRQVFHCTTVLVVQLLSYMYGMVLIAIVWVC